MSDQTPNSNALFTTSVRETDKLNKDLRVLLEKKNEELANENNRLLEALESQSLISYGEDETKALIWQLREKNAALKFELARSREKLKIANRNYMSYLNKYVNLAERAKRNDK